MKKVFIIRKYVFAETAEAAMKLDKKTPIHDCWVEEGSLKDSIAALQKQDPKKIGFHL